MGTMGITFALVALVVTHGLCQGNLGTLIPAAFRGCSGAWGTPRLGLHRACCAQTFLAGLHFVDPSSIIARSFSALDFLLCPRAQLLPLGVSRRTSTVGAVYMQ